MSKKATRKRSTKTVIGSGLAVLLILASIGHGHMAHRIQRPIAATGGVINQTYLWAENGHRGVDFTYGLGTDVYAAAGGWVVNFRENLPNGDTSTAWGNFVLIRSQHRHYDRTAGQMAYVYYMYLHLSQNSVRVQDGDWVNAGDWIAEVDDTGANSSGHHLHLQIVLHPLADRRLEPPPSTLDSENRSRNPELWLTPFNFGNDETGTVVGRVSDTDGNPVSNLRIYGIEKPDAAGGNVYEWSQTYSYDWANPDDILVENFGTTDVEPGTYHIVAKQYSGGQWVEYRDLGWHTVEDGLTTYAGLYPVYLPDVKVNHNGWTSTIIVRNNSTTHSAEVNTTFFQITDWPYYQRADNLAPGAVVSFTPPDFWGGFSGSAIVVASEDVSVIVRSKRNNELTIYNGIMASGSTSGWEQTGSTLYVPVAKNNWAGRYSSIDVVNAGSAGTTSAGTTVYAYFYDYADSGGSGDYKGYLSAYLTPNARHTFNASSKCPSGHYCAVRLWSSSGQPLAAVVREYAADGGDPATYNAVSGGASTGYAPVVKSNWGNQNSGLAVMNTSSQSADVTITYYDTNSNAYYTDYLDDIPPKSVRNSWVPDVVGVDPFLGSAYVYSNRDVVVLLAESGNGFYKSSNAFSGGTATSYIAELFNYASGTKSGISVQNLHGSQAYVRVRYYDLDGSYRAGEDDYATIFPREQYSFHYWNGELPTNFHGSAWVESVYGQPIAVMVHEFETTTPGPDRNAAFNGSNR